MLVQVSEMIIHIIICREYELIYIMYSYEYLKVSGPDLLLRTICISYIVLGK